MRKTALLLALALLLAPLLAAAQEAAPIDIGIAYPCASIDADTHFKEGYTMAIDRVNAGGGVLGRPLNAVVRDDENDISTALRIGQTFVTQGVTAVIGHWSSNVCCVVEELYNTHQIPMITPAATSMSLFDDPTSYIFRTIPSTDLYAQVLAQRIADSGLSRIAIYYTDDVYGSAFANCVELELQALGVSVVDRATSVSPANAQRIADRWNAFGADGVIVAAVMPEAAQVIHLIRSMHPTFPVYGAENFDRKSFAADLGGDISRVQIASYDLSRIDQDFLAAFRDQFGCDPDAFAITGYQSVMMLADAIRETGGTDAAAIAEWLRSLDGYRAAGGTLRYDAATREFIGHALCVRPVEASGQEASTR